MNRLFTALILLAVTALLVMWSRGSVAQVAPLAAMTIAKETGRVPPWADVTDRIWLRPIWPTVARVCIENRQGPGRWVLVGSMEQLTGFYDTGTVTFGPDAAVKPATPADLQACWPDYVPPAPAKPVALGEPAYFNLVCPDGCVDGKPVDKVAMRASIAGNSIAGEACGPPVGQGFYLLDRLSSPKGHRAMTRCKP